MINVALNGIVEMNRGDTATFPVYVDIGTTFKPILYELRPGDNLYFAVMEPQQKWEDALLKKTYDYTNFDQKSFSVLVHLYSEDTEYLAPGTYYYEIKLRKDPKNNDDGYESVETIVPRTKFIIVE